MGLEFGVEGPQLSIQGSGFRVQRFELRVKQIVFRLERWRVRRTRAIGRIRCWDDSRRVGVLVRRVGLVPSSAASPF